MICDCAICKRGRSVARVIKSLPTARRAYVKALYDSLCDVEMDRDYYRALVSGAWPDADKVIAAIRK